MPPEVAVVTGGGRGIGRAMVQALARAGSAVAVLARTASELDETVAACDGRAVGHAVDVTDHAAVARAAEAVEAELGPVTLLVNNAGAAGEMGPTWEADPAVWWDTVAGHLQGAFNCARVLLPGMVERGRGRIVNVVSGLGARDDPYVSAYSCGKAGLIRLTGVLAAEAGEHGVTVLALSPGLVRTRMTSESILGEPGRRYFPAFAELPESAFTAPERVGEALVRIAAGEADALSGRLVQVGTDV